ncbi:MAG: DNA adenine methylase [Rhodospirillales bacterium]|nr:DNA adenine methylase [Rhodospirillales bacterium]
MTARSELIEPQRPVHPVAPVAPVAPYVGGKRLLAKTVIERIEAIPHKLYAEPFVGMGGIFLRRRSAPRHEVINDISRDVYGLFRVLQEHYSYFVDYLKFQVASRAEFERLQEVVPDTLTDIQRAARFLYLQRIAFGGKVQGRSFGVKTDKPSRFDLTRLVPMLDDLHERLAGVVIECLPYADFLARYDKPATLFYLDPPYWGSEDYYGKEVFTRADFEKLAGILSNIKGRFILSLNDTAGVRETFGAFSIEAATTRYSLNGSKPKETGEVIITNGYPTTT